MAVADDPAPRTRAIWALRRTTMLCNAVLDHLLSAEGTTIAQYGVMYVLTSGPLSGAELARRASVSDPTMSRLLAGLERRKLVTRRQDSAGGRAVLATLTPAGRELVERCHRYVDAVEAWLLSDLAEKDFRRAEDLLSRWSERLQQLQQPKGAAVLLSLQTSDEDKADK